MSKGHLKIKTQREVEHYEKTLSTEQLVGNI